MMRYLVLMAVLLTPFLAPSVGLADTRRLAVDAGTTVLLSQPHLYGPDCVLIAPELRVDQPPARGTIVVRTARYPLGDYAGGRERAAVDGDDPCAGRLAEGPQVLYRAPADAGTDRFTMSGDFGEGRVITVAFVVEIR